MKKIIITSSVVLIAIAVVCGSFYLYIYNKNNNENLHLEKVENVMSNYGYEIINYNDSNKMLYFENYIEDNGGCIVNYYDEKFNYYCSYTISGPDPMIFIKFTSDNNFVYDNEDEQIMCEVSDEYNIVDECKIYDDLINYNEENISNTRLKMFKIKEDIINIENEMRVS